VKDVDNKIFMELCVTSFITGGVDVKLIDAQSASKNRARRLVFSTLTSNFGITEKSCVRFYGEKHCGRLFKMITCRSARENILIDIHLTRSQLYQHGRK
jgi:hypothetical protein